MRYFIVRYLRQPSGKMNEEIAVSKRLRTRDLQTAAVILDFRDLQVVLASLDGNTVPRNFDRICQYYRQHYKDTIDQLLAAHGRQVRTSDLIDPDKEPTPDQ
jgi:hypothetical protein